jgi:zinc/manganese transport system permease protein
MIHALLAGILVSITAGLLGLFVIIRHYTFASHALGHIGIPGATGAILLGFSPLLGLSVFCIVGGILIGALGEKMAQREISTGSILAFATALGLYFSGQSSKASKTMQSVLFGNILGVSDSDLTTFAIFTAVIVVIALLIYRPLLFASIVPDVAKVRGVKVQVLNILFVILLALVTTMSVQVVGSLLLFALLITPTTTALNFTANPILVTISAIFLSITSVVLGIVASAALNVSPSFAIVTVSTVFWLASKAVRKIKFS